MAKSEYHRTSFLGTEHHITIVTIEEYETIGSMHTSNEPAHRREVVSIEHILKKLYRHLSIRL